MIGLQKMYYRPFWRSIHCGLPSCKIPITMHRHIIYILGYVTNFKYLAIPMTKNIRNLLIKYNGYCNVVLCRVIVMVCCFF